MRIGHSFPTTEIGNDPAVIRDYIQSIEGMGYDYVTILEHVAGERNPPADDWRAYYTRDRAFHEPFALMGFFAAATSRIRFKTAILILPQRQTVLVAKQAAEVDVLSGGRLDLGVGLGWNKPEFDMLGERFTNRNRRMEEQIEVMRRLWTEELVTFEGEFHTIRDAGINPLPVQRPIPLWIGAFADVAVERAGRLADGWLLNPRDRPDNEAQASINLFRRSADEAGRDGAALGLDVTIWAHQGGPDEWRALHDGWRAMGASHLTFRTMQSDFTNAEGHLGAARRFMETIGRG